MRERSRELKAAAGKAEAESDVLAKIAEMPEPDRVMAERLHALIKASSPALSPRTWCGMPAYAKDGKVVCFFQSAQKFKDEVRHVRVQRQGEPRRRRHVADLLRAEGADRRRREEDRRAREESGELRARHLVWLEGRNGLRQRRKEPDGGHVHGERKIRIDAPGSAVYERIVDFHRWPAWSPYEELDPGMERTYAGAESGLGAVYEWSGNLKAGSGRMEIVDAVDDERVVIDQRNLKPLRSEATTTFALDDSGDGTAVTLSTTGPVTLITRIMGIFKSMDRMVGPVFQKGTGEAQGRRRGRATFADRDGLWAVVAGDPSGARRMIAGVSPQTRPGGVDPGCRRLMGAREP